MSVIYVVQEQHVPDAGQEHLTAVRGMLGACLLGALEHYGRAQHAKHGTTTKSEVLLWHLPSVFRRNRQGRKDTGLHGFGFEYAVHAAINGAPGIPSAVAARVQSNVAAHAGAVFDSLGLPWSSVGDGIRSVMFGVEKLYNMDNRRTATVAELGAGALLWPEAGAEPLLLADWVPKLGCRASSRAGNRRRPQVEGADRFAQPDVPDSINHLWRADLFLGAAEVEQSPALERLVGDAVPRAWLGATLKYRPGRLEGGRGLHIGIDTNHGLRSERQPSDHYNGLRHVQLRVEDAFLTVFHTAWRLLTAVANEGFPSRSHETWMERKYAPLVEEFGKRKKEAVLTLAHDLLGEAPVVSVRSEELATRTPLRRPLKPSYSSLPGLPIMAPVPNTLSVVAA